MTSTTETNPEATSAPGHPALVEGDPAGSPEALIEEARRRQRRRRVWTAALALALAAALGGGLLWAGGSGDRSPARTATHPDGGGGAGPVGVRTLTLRGPFSPQQMAATAGRVWLIGTTPLPTTRSGCAIESVDPTTLRTRRYPLAGCGDNVAVGDGHVYVAALAHVPGTNTTLVRVERFDPATGRATVLAPVEMTLSGSSRAHTAMAYGDGSLWLWGYAGGGGPGGDVVRISPSTGAVTGTVTGLPDIGGGQPIMVATGGGLWLTGGAGTSTVDHLAWGTPAPSVDYSGPPGSSVVWLSVAGRRVWIAVAGPQGDGAAPTTRLVALDPGGPPVTESSPAPVGVAPTTGSGRQLWVVGSSGSACADPLRLWRIDPATGTGKAVLTLPTTVQPCLSGPAVAVIGRTAFALVGDAGRGSAVLYRVTG